MTIIDIACGLCCCVRWGVAVVVAALAWLFCKACGEIERKDWLEWD